jgi:hypothetical protein
MAERFSKIEQRYRTGTSLEERLKEYPELKGKIEKMLEIIENSGGDVEKAAEAERRIIEEMRQMANEVLHGWARRQQQKKEEEHAAKPGVNRKEKKPLLVHAGREDRNHRTDFHSRPSRRGDSAVFGFGPSRMPRLLGRAATSDHGLWSGRSVCESQGKVAGTLWD